MDESLKNNKKSLVIGAIFFLIILVSVVGYMSRKGSDPTLVLKEKTFHVELGEKVSSDPATYLDNAPANAKKAKVDLSKVNENEVGEYKASIKSDKQTLKFTIAIEDTEAPKIKVHSDVKVLTNEPVSSTVLVDSIKDASDLTEYTIDEEYVVDEPETIDLSNSKLPEYTLKFPESGRISVTITATDSYRNTSKEMVQITVEDEPEIKGMDDMTVTVGDDVDWLENLEYDESEVKKIKADDSEVDLEKAGEYTLKYDITMKSGQIYTREVKVTVEDEKTKAEREKKEAESKETETAKASDSSNSPSTNTNTQTASNNTQQADDEPYVGNSGHTFTSWDAAENYAKHRMETNDAKDYEISADGAGGFTVDFIY